eukprot:TRINITY_DN3900_c0_g1_i1.p1 TRINITY_DN3900_c0_g1~~TRINITY_DN3900_c0_g1_i1.p1  ORF type:complete len:147 (-),score=68.04 TRINITY_DN3900_c0_g1_i1:74-514(-)
MATRAVASAVFPLPIDRIWSHLRDFTFPARAIPTIESVIIEDNRDPSAVGATRVIRWKTGESRKQRLIELSDQHYRITWELIESDPIAEASAVITSVKLYRISENNTTLVEWSSDFSADATGSFVTFEQNSYMQNLREIRSHISSQ